MSARQLSKSNSSRRERKAKKMLRVGQLIPMARWKKESNQGEILRLYLGVVHMDFNPPWLDNDLFLREKYFHSRCQPEEFPINHATDRESSSLAFILKNIGEMT